MGDETDAPDIRRFNEDQYGPVEFAFITGKGFEKIFNGGIDDFDARCFFQDIIEEVYQFAYDKGGRNIAHDQYDSDHHHKAKSGYSPGLTTFIQGQPGEQMMNEIGQNAVDPAKQGKNRPERDGDGGQDDQSLQKIFEQFTRKGFEFHEQRFVFQK